MEVWPDDIDPIRLGNLSHLSSHHHDPDPEMSLPSHAHSDQPQGSGHENVSSPM